MLIAIGIIAAVLTILLPTLNAARRRANQVGCANNMRTIYSAIQSYSNEARGWIPRDCVPDDRNATSFAVISAKRLGFPAATHENVKQCAFLQCPEHPLKGDIPGCYASNAFAFVMDGVEPGKYSSIMSRSSWIHNPSGVIYLVDIATKFIQLDRETENFIYDAVGHDLFLPDDVKAGFPRAAPARHGQTVNILMFDGSVRSAEGEQKDLRLYDDGRCGLNRPLFDQDLPPGTHQF